MATPLLTCPPGICPLSWPRTPPQCAGLMWNLLILVDIPGKSTQVKMFLHCQGCSVWFGQSPFCCFSLPLSHGIAGGTTQPRAAGSWGKILQIPQNEANCCFCSGTLGKLLQVSLGNAGPTATASNKCWCSQGGFSSFTLHSLLLNELQKSFRNPSEFWILSYGSVP